MTRRNDLDVEMNGTGMFSAAYSFPRRVHSCLLIPCAVLAGEHPVVKCMKYFPFSQEAGVRA